MPEASTIPVCVFYFYTVPMEQFMHRCGVKNTQLEPIYFKQAEHNELEWDWLLGPTYWHINDKQAVS